MTQDTWLLLGIDEGWCTQPFCATHEGPPEDSFSPEELAELEEGGDPCWHAVRLIVQ